jgi:hypothetical protein
MPSREIDTSTHLSCIEVFSLMSLFAIGVTKSMMTDAVLVYDDALAFPCRGMFPCSWYREARADPATPQSDGQHIWTANIVNIVTGVSHQCMPIRCMQEQTCCYSLERDTPSIPSSVSSSVMVLIPRDCSTLRYLADHPT